jgi:hypothetical protein
MRAACISLMLTVALGACAHSAGSGQSASPAPSSPIAFPLYQGSSVLSVRDWRATVRQQSGQEHAFFPGGPGNYTGHEVIAQTTASMDDLENWLQTIGTTPPSGYAAYSGASNLQDTRTRLQRYGLDFEIFRRGSDAKQGSVVVIAIDPEILTTKAAPILPLLAKYRSLPDVLRAPIDAETQEREGFSLSEALDPATPIGAAIAALDQLRASGERGVVLVDAAKQ